MDVGDKVRIKPEYWRGKRKFCLNEVELFIRDNGFGFISQRHTPNGFFVGTSGVNGSVCIEEGYLIPA